MREEGVWLGEEKMGVGEKTRKKNEERVGLMGNYPSALP